jgi:hypothetical protein
MNLQKEKQDIGYWIFSTCVTMSNLVFLTLEYTTKLIILELPQDPDAALICVDAVTLFHGIGTEFSTTSKTQNRSTKTRRRVLSTLSLVLHSSFQTSLPQVFGSKNLVGVGYKGVLLPYAKTYTEWYSDNDGIMSGVNQRIEEGLKIQINVYQGAIDEVSYTHPSTTIIATIMIDTSVKCCETILILIDNMNTKDVAHRREIKPDESWL